MYRFIPNRQRVLAFFIVLLPGVVAYAQEESLVSDRDAPGEMDEIVVTTASRIIRPDYSYSNPVLSVSGEDVQASGIRDMADFLKQLPALAASIDSHDTSGGGFAGTNGLTALDLRGLGLVRTLVLVNGRRYVGSPFPGASFVDVDTLPLHLIERVEVMTGGASAIYGADAVSGVVNFEMKDRYEGLDVSVRGAVSGEGDARSQTASMTYGTSIAAGRGHLSISLNHVRDDALDRLSRSFTSPEGYTLFAQNPDNPGGSSEPTQVPLTDLRFFDFAPGGAVDVTMDGIPDFNGDGRPWMAGTFVAPSYDQGGDGSVAATFLPDTLPERTSTSFNVLGDYALTENMRLFSEFGYQSRESIGEFLPTYDYLLVVFPDAPFVPEAITTAAAGNPVGVTRDHFDLGIRTEETERETYRAVVGLEASLSGGMDFETSYTYGETDVSSVQLNNRYNDGFAAALDAVIDPVSGEVVCASELDPAAEPYNLQSHGWNRYEPLPGTWAGSYMPGLGECVPINIFGEGAPSQAAIDWIMVDSTASANMKQHVLQAYVRHSVPIWQAERASYVLGMEWRREEVFAAPPEEDRLGLTFGLQFDPEMGSQEVTEVFAEVDVPLLTQARFADYLAIDAAVRFSDYSTIGSATTWKYGIVWDPVENLTVRGTVAEATRAPSLQELNSPIGQSFDTITDPCDINNLVNGTEFREGNCAQLLGALGVDPATYTTPSTSVSVSGLNGGNPNLVQETADTITLGIIYRPSFADQLTVSLDWYDIELKDAIEFAFPGDAANLCVDLPSLDNNFCDLITRGDNGGISAFVQQPENVAALSTRGVDFRLAYRFDLGSLNSGRDLGTIDVELSGNNLRELRRVSLPGATPVSQLGQPDAPEWQTNLDVQWSAGDTLVRWQVHYFDETNRFDDLTTRNNPTIVAPQYLQYDRKLTHDLYANHQVTRQLSLHAGVNNLLNEQPDIGAVNYPVSAVGRYLYLGLRYLR
ncbi:MAG: TonB-dependent receptor [Pseudomonadota bacterium]